MQAVSCPIGLLVAQALQVVCSSCQKTNSVKVQKGEDSWLFKQAATVTAVTGIATASQIDSSYVPGGTNVHSKLIHGSLSQCEYGHQRA